MVVVLGGDSARAELQSGFDRMDVRSLARLVTFAQLSGIGLEGMEPASAALRRKARLRTADPEGAHWILAGLALNQGRPSEAREAVEAAREFSPGHQVLWNHVLNALLSEGDSAIAMDAVGLLRPIDNGLYDFRARTCQFFAPPPSDDLVYIDIDDQSLDAIGEFPWPRDTLASIVDEVHRAGARTIAFDIIFDKPQPKADAALAEAKAAKRPLLIDFSAAPA
jgi:hypothetical protein